MRRLFDAAGVPTTRLLVLLPAAKARPEDFFEHGFIDLVRRRRLPLDVVAVDAHSDYYLEGDLAERLDAEVLGPMAATGYDEVWLAGVSLGGLGCLGYACRDGARVAGTLLLAPFLGVRGPDRQPEMLAALSRYRTTRGRLPRIFLGYGVRDRYAAASETLAGLLPAGHTITIDGGHDWPTWSALWRLMLTRAFG